MKQKSISTSIVVFVVSVVIAVLFGSCLWDDIRKLCSGIVYRLDFYDSNLPRVSHVTFVGREKELDDILSSLDFNNVTRLVTIVGSPGFGKSALALQAGHQLLRNGFSVFYVDMQEAPSVLALTEKDLDSAPVEKKIMLKWANALRYESVLILDNCDDVLDGYQEKFQDIVQKLLASSQKLKMVTTSRIKKLYLEHSHHIKLPPLPTDDACHLLESFVSTLNQSEKEKLVHLAGSVPLALKVVASILTGPDSPGPQVIIKRLSDELIKTLSPEELSTKNRVNASIYLSYKHLTSMTQKVGRCLSEFPVSFNGTAACKIFHSVARDVENCSDILNTLRQRSLLEQNQRTQRYQFHPLIREFFMEMQKSLGIYKEENTLFSVAFIDYYTDLLNKIAETSGVDALNHFDTESLNILHMLQIVSKPSNALKEHTSSESIFFAVKAICNYRVFKLLQGRFSLDELYNSFERIDAFLQEFEASYFHIQEFEVYFHIKKFGAYTPSHNMCQMRNHFFNTYMLYMEHISVLIFKKFEEEKIYDVILKQKEWVERMYTCVPGTEFSIFYLKFYRRCVSLIKDPEIELYKECHENLLKATGDLKNCSSSCEYNSIGFAYHTIGKASEAKMFLQLAIDHQPGLHIITRVIILVTLSDLYSIDGNTEESNRLAMEAILLFPNLTEFMSVTDLQQHPLDMHAIALFYQTHEKYDEATTILTKLIQSYKNFPKNMDKDKFITAWKIVHSWKKMENYSAAREIASIALNGYKDFSERDVVDRDVQRIYIQLQMLSGIINGSNGSAHLQSVISYIKENNITHLYASELVEACIRLAFKGQYHSCLGDILVDTAMFVFFLMFHSGFSHFEARILLPVTVENSDETSFQDLVLSTDLILPDSHAITVLNQFGLYHSPYNYFHEYSTLFVNFCYNILLFVFSSDFFKLVTILIKVCLWFSCIHCCRCNSAFRCIALFMLVLCFIIALKNEF